MMKRIFTGLVVLGLGCSSGRSGTGNPTGSGGQVGPSGGTDGRTGGADGRTGGTGGSGGRVGSGGSGGVVAGGTGGVPAPPAGNSVLERNNHPSRDGHFVQPTLTKAASATLARDATFAGTFTGSMWASPLYLENGPGGKGLYFAVTTGNDVIALDEATGAPAWPPHNIGPSPMSNGTQANGNPVCGSIHPLGIISTPVIDAQTRTIYVAGAIGTTSIMRHEVHALSVDDGSERPGWPVDVSGVTSGTLAFSAGTIYQNQRSALSLVNGILYVAYGGHVGDCGPYHGWVVAINTTGATPTVGAWATGGVGEAIWAAGGMASDGNGVFAMTGNHMPRGSDATRVDSEEVVRITGLGRFDRVNANLFVPQRWSAMDLADADLGSNSPVLIQVPGATPSSLLVAISKDGHMFLLNSANLGGMGGQVVDFPIAATGMNVLTAPAAYTTAAGVHVVFSALSAMCPAGGPAGRAIMSVLIPPGAPPVPRVAWCAPLAGSNTSPIATTTDGRSDAIVWYMSNNRLTGVDGDTGAVVVTSADTCTAVRQWTSPIAVKGHIVVGGDGHLCSWSPH